MSSSSEERKVFSYHLLNDLKSLDYMVRNKLLEDDVVRIGAEQEFCLVNDDFRPSSKGCEILEDIEDKHFTSELAKFNLEINLDPVKLEKDAFYQVESQLKSLLKKAENIALKHKAKIVLTGILPSISTQELNLNYITPLPRYLALNDLLKAQRGSDFKMSFSEVDELFIAHDSIMFEACNTSFQLHLQIEPDDFTSSYNWAQAISGPMLGICANSPYLFGRELWQETRIALFQQSIDTREISSSLQNKQARVSFGENWLSGGIQDYYRNELSKFKNIITKEVSENSFEALEKGNIPKLEALNLFNGTVYRWNRPCYGVGGDKPHIRIENRYIPAGPTIADEIANFAFWVGLMKGRPSEFDDLPAVMDFSDAKSNFLKAARNGVETILSWMDKNIPLPQLVREILLPIAKEGLKKMNINSADIDRYLGIILSRLDTYTGARWCIINFRHLKHKLKTNDASIALTQGLFYNQQNYDKISEWPKNMIQDTFESKATQVDQIMSTSLVTFNQHDSAMLTIQFMKWNDIHHLPIVNHKEELRGLLTWTHIEEHWKDITEKGKELSASDIMIKKVITASPATPIAEAKAIMQTNQIGCLPIVSNGVLVGILTKKDVF